MSGECLNCESALGESFKFCPHCSQQTDLHRLTLHDILHDALHYFTHADKGFIQLLKELAIKTGRVAKEYISGKRKKYFPPLNFFLLVATIYVLITSLSALQTSSGNVLREPSEVSNIPDKARREHVLHIYERKEKAQHFMSRYSNIVAMIAVPLITLLYWLFYIRGRYNYTEHLIGCMYMVGFTNLFYVVFLYPLSLLFVKQSTAPLILALIFMVLQVIYNSIFYFHFINKQSKSSAFKATATSLFVVLFWFAFSGLLVGLYISNGFWGYAK